MDFIEVIAIIGSVVALLGFLNSVMRLRAALPGPSIEKLDFSERTILIIEPNRAMRIIMASTMKGMAHVIGCSSFEKASELFEKKLIPSVIIMETPANAEDGMNFIQSLINNNVRQKAKIIMVSRVPSRENYFLEAYRKLIDTYFEKPFEPLDVRKAVSDFFDRSFTSAKLIHYRTYFDIMNPSDKGYRIPVLKRVFDIVLSLLLLVFLSPVFLIIALAIKIDSRGPIFYRSKRSGKNYQILSFLKFRTMHSEADKRMKELKELNQYTPQDIYTPKFFMIANDPRVSSVGKFLRRTYLDELPQLIHILTGEMSFVGNRPLPLYEARTLTTDEYAAIFIAPGGLLGNWQVAKLSWRNHRMSVEDRIGLDIYYSRNWSFRFDLYIILKYIKSLFGRDFSYPINGSVQKIPIDNPKYGKAGAVVKFYERSPDIILRKIKEEWMVEAN